MIDVVEDPVAGIVPVDVPDGLPPVEAAGFDAAAMVNVTVRVPLLGPVDVTVYVPAAVGAAVKVTVAVPTEAACRGRTRPATGTAQVVVWVIGVDCGWVTVMVSPTRQFGCVTL